MVAGLKSRFYKLKRNIQKVKEITGFGKSLSGTVSHDNVTFEEAYENLNLFKAFQPSQKVSEIKLLYEKVRIDQPKVICEIGSYKGGTLFLLSQAAPNDALLISIDINYPLARKLAHKNLVKKGQQLICVEGDTQDPKTLSRVIKLLKGRDIDFLFIDGDHSLFGVMNDYVRFYPLVKAGGAVAFHDIHPDSEMLTGVKTTNFVGGVPVFWNAVKYQFPNITEFVEDENQDGFGIGILEVP